MVFGKQKLSGEKNRYAAAETNESLISGNAAVCEQGWLGNVYGCDWQNTGFIKEGFFWSLGTFGNVFSPSLRVWFKACWNEWRDSFCLKVFLSWTPRRFSLGRSLHRQRVSACPGTGWLCPRCPSITCGPWRYMSSKLPVLTLEGGQGARKDSNQGQGTWKRKRNLLIKIWHPTGPL